MIKLMPLPYSLKSLEPYLSRTAIKYHYEKHHRNYVNTLNSLIKGTNLQKQDLETILRVAEGKIYNQAAQVYNHNLWWNSMTPQKGLKPLSNMMFLIKKDFGSLKTFKSYFKSVAMTQFGSGWTWVTIKDEQLYVTNSPNAENPFKEEGVKILFVLDLLEHAYYLDYKHNREQFIDNYLKILNWNFIESQI